MCLFRVAAYPGRGEGAHTAVTVGRCACGGAAGCCGSGHGRRRTAQGTDRTQSAEGMDLVVFS